MKSSTLVCVKLDKSNMPYSDFTYNLQTLRFHGEFKQEKIRTVVVRELKEGEESMYWAWWDNAMGLFVPGFIWPSKGQVSMCFPYGPEIEEEKGRGKLLRVMIEEIKIGADK